MEYIWGTSVNHICDCFGIGFTNTKYTTEELCQKCQNASVSFAKECYDQLTKTQQKDPAR